jgi:tetratricopeptide (TPR) repeat protein
MNLEILLKAVCELEQAKSKEEFNAAIVYYRHLDLLSEESIRTLREMADEEENQNAETLRRIATKLAETAQRVSANEIEVKRLIAESPVLWAKLLRRYIASGNEKFLSEAIAEAQKISETEIVSFLKTTPWDDLIAFDHLSTKLFKSFQTVERYEEALTIALINTHIRTKFVESFKHYNLEEQAEVLETGIRACLDSVQMTELLGDESCKAIYLFRAGGGSQEKQQFVDAEAFYTKALIIWRNLAIIEPQIYEIDVVLTLSNLSFIQIELGKFVDAETSCSEALSIIRKLAKAQPQIYDPDVAIILSKLGLAQNHLRKLAEAEESYHEALKIQRKLATTHPEIYEIDLAESLNNLATTQSELGKFADAEASYMEALTIRRKLVATQPKIYEPYLARILSNLSLVQGKLGKFADAETSCNEALSIRRKLAKIQPQIYDAEVAGTLNNLGIVQSDLQKLDQASFSYVEALERFRQLATIQPQVYEREVVMVLNNLGLVQNQLQKLVDAETSYMEALNILQRYDLPVLLGNVLSNISLVKLKQKNWQEAENYLRQAMKQVELLRAETQSLDHRRQIIDKNSNIYEYLVVCLMKLGKYREALEIAERGKSRSLIDLLSLRDFRPKSASLALVEEYEKAMRRAQELESFLSPKSLSRFEINGESENENSGERIEHLFEKKLRQKIQAARQERVEVNAELQRFVNEIRKYDSDYLPFAKPLRLEEILNLGRDAKKTLILFRVTVFGTYVFLVFPDGTSEVITVESFTTENLSDMLVKYETGELIDGWIMRYYDYLNVPKPSLKARDSHLQWLNTIDNTLGMLYEDLLKPVHQALENKAREMGDEIRQVVLIPNLGLAILPLHASWWLDKYGNKRYLLDEYVISYAPSLYVLKRCLERESENRANDKLCLVANPTQDLDFSSEECQEIKKTMKSRTVCVLSENEATKTAILNAMKQHNWLHFSCHGHYTLNAPFESALSLAETVEDTGTLSLDEIMNTNLNHIWLVVLSACETGLTDFREVSDEHYGLPLGFIFAGAPSVWGTLWSVQDDATSELMVNAYRYLNNGLTKPEALRQAQIDLRNDAAQHFSHPYFWAGFQSFGA